MRNLQELIKEKHGIEALQQLWQWEKCVIKDCDFKKHRIFTLRCISKGVIPVSVRLGSTRKDITKKAREIIYKVEKQLLQERVRYINVILDNNGKNLEISRSRLVSLVTTTATQGKWEDFINKVREDRFNKIKQRQVSKFNRLINKTSIKDRETGASSSNYIYQSQTSRGQSNQARISNNNNKWVVNLSKISLTPAQLSLLGKGSNFVVTHKAHPNVDYISATNITEQDVQELKSDVNSLLQRVPAPKTNLTRKKEKV